MDGKKAARMLGGHFHDSEIVFSKLIRINCTAVTPYCSAEFFFYFFAKVLKSNKVCAAVVITVGSG